MDELERLDDLRARHGPIFRRGPGVLYVGEPAAAKAVLANTGSRYREHSDFFRTGRGTFGPRSAQQEVGRAARNLLGEHWTARSDRLAATVERVIGPESRWPDAGNLLFHQCFRDVLTPEGELRGLVDQVVRHAVSAGARDRRSVLSRAVLRSRVRRALVAELSRRRARPARSPADLLDVLAAAAPGASSRTAQAQLAEVFLSFLFAVTGSTGFLLGWSVYLLGANPAAGGDLTGVVREALRLRPVAWNFGRSPAEPHRLAGFEVTTSDEVVVCSYLVHRDSRFWPDPDEFLPQRWSAGAPRGDAEAFIPFGWGAHTCVAAGFAVRLVEDVLRLLPPARRWRVEAHRRRPHVAAALAPPEFTLRTNSAPTGRGR
ncbi:cytochrome P450 [Saccharothrix algeriensis]|uniref:Cytochrome P450 n=1 Tax=Saccharothrix algeriensis TaxID=173560 RepID=A0A8T8I1F4_9PSEU|nr:cytochrome P450 [Saccharothrix algeriensis]MBM7810086.1 cytochrome P450 [Saccharothrix algeriensis]QTR04300.1 cytochrome P450 [Saccharothrix algeriensis]